jgi:hypothetical protein
MGERDLRSVKPSKIEQQQNRYSISGIDKPSVTVMPTTQKNKHYQLFIVLKLIAALLVGQVIAILTVLSPIHNQLISIGQPIVILLVFLTINYLIIRYLPFKRTLYRVLLDVLIIIVLGPIFVFTLVFVASKKDSYDNRPAVVEAIYAQTANADSKIILANSTGASLFKEARLSVTINNKDNEVHNLYCYTVPITDSSSIVSDLTTGLAKVPVTNQGFQYTGSPVLVDQVGYIYQQSGSIVTKFTPQDINILQSQFTQNGQIALPSTIWGGNGNGNVYNGAIAMKTTNPKFYPSANIDIQVNQRNQCYTDANQINTSGKLIVSVDADLTDNSIASGLF